MKVVANCAKWMERRMASWIRRMEVKVYMWANRHAQCMREKNNTERMEKTRLKIATSGSIGH